MTNDQQGTAPSRVRKFEWSIANGYVQFSFPEALSHTDIDDIEGLFSLVLKGMRRRAPTTDEAETPAEDQDTRP